VLSENVPMGILHLLTLMCGKLVCVVKGGGIAKGGHTTLGAGLCGEQQHTLQ